MRTRQIKKCTSSEINLSLDLEITNKKYYLYIVLIVIFKEMIRRKIINISSTQINKSLGML